MRVIRELPDYEEYKELVHEILVKESGNCPVMPVVEMLQGKWKLQLLYWLIIQSPMRFGELKKKAARHHQYHADKCAEGAGTGWIHRQRAVQ